MGAVLGILVAISSVGAGAVGVIALIMLYPQLPMSRIVGSDIAHAVPLTLIAGMGHWMIGSVDWYIIGSLLVGSLPGIILGSYTAVRVSRIGAAIIAGRDSYCRRREAPLRSGRKRINAHRVHATGAALDQS